MRKSCEYIPRELIAPLRNISKINNINKVTNKKFIKLPGVADGNSAQNHQDFLDAGIKSVEGLEKGKTLRRGLDYLNYYEMSKVCQPHYSHHLKFLSFYIEIKAQRSQSEEEDQG